MFVEKNQTEGAVGPLSLLSVPGFRAWSGAGVTDRVGRAAIVASGRLFVVIGAGLYEFDINGAPTKRNPALALAQNANPAQLQINGPVGGQLLCSSGGNAYCLVLSSNAFTQVLTGTADMIGYAGGFFLAFQIATGIVKLSALNDGTTWGSNFFQRSLLPDPWQAMFVDGNGLVWLVGTESFEVWQNTGTGTQPFAPLSGLYGLYGIAAPFAFALTPAPCWLVANRLGGGTLIIMDGEAAKPVTNYAVANQFSSFNRDYGIANAEILPYQDNGHTFVNVAFPGPQSTWSYDIEGQGWHERGLWNPVTGLFGLWAPRVHVEAYGKHLVADRASGTIWQMDSSFATEMDGTGIRKLRRTPALVDELKRHPLDRIQLLVDNGLGPNGAIVEPKITARGSYNLGKTWGNERQAGMGLLGNFRRRVYWTRWGTPEVFNLEIVCSDPVPLRISGAWINPTEGEMREAA